MAVLQSASLDLEAEIFLCRVAHYALEVFSSIEHVVKENKYEYEQSKLSTDRCIQRLEEVKIEYHAQEE